MRSVVGHSLSHKLRYLAIFIPIVAAMGMLFLGIPTSYLPDEDQGILLAQIIIPRAPPWNRPESRNRSSGISMIRKRRRWSPA